jgi:hypothetical protein
VSVTVQGEAGWNMMSNPVARPESLNSVRALFPLSSFDYAFMFDPAGGYVQSPVMEGGSGYWVKLSQGGTTVLTGALVWTDSIPVRAGWNMIGSISAEVDTGSVRTQPPGLRASLFYGYADGYDPVSVRAPGDAVWVKSNDSGLFILTGSAPPGPAPGSAESFDRFGITDAQGRTRRLFFGRGTAAGHSPGMLETPPLPPEGIPDARFDSNSIFALADTAGDHEWGIELTSFTYPVTVSWHLDGAHTPATLRCGGQSYSLRETGSVVVADPAAALCLVTHAALPSPHECELAQNYPNPFNPSTRVAYALTAGCRSVLRVYDITGRLVRTLHDGWQEAGFYGLDWDGANDAGRRVSSGVYFYRLEAPGFTRTRKMLLLK